MNQLSSAKRAQMVHMLVEGNSVRATARMASVDKKSVLRLLPRLGEACRRFQDRTLRSLPCRRVQVDELWGFVHAKARNVPPSMAFRRDVGDVWLWLATCADTKLVATYAVGGRDAGTGRTFMRDLASRLAHRIQLSSDGLPAYVLAVDDAFGNDVDFAQIQKLYGTDSNPRRPETRYSPGRCRGVRRVRIIGDPKPEHMSTSYAERNNLTVRMSMRRFARLTNAFSKKFENLCHAISLHFAFYNWCRVHQTLKMTPAQAAGLTDERWTMEQLVGLAA